MKILVVRGAFLNIFEMQSYVPLKEQVDIRAIGSHRPIHTYVGIPTTRFFSPYDLGTIGQSIPLWPQMIRAVANRTIGDPHFLLGLERYVRENGPFDIAHGAETYYGYDLQLAKLKKRGHVKKLVLTCWDTIGHNNEGLTAKKQIKRLVKKETDAYLAVTLLASNALVAEGVSADKIHVVYPGLDLSRFTPQVRESISRPIKILVVGRLSWEKGVHDVGRVLVGLHEQGILFECSWIGSGPLRSQLRFYADQLPAGSLNIKHVAYDNMPHEYHKHDLLLHLARSDEKTAEQFGMAVAEAMACGLPVIAYDTGALKEVIGDAGICIPQGSVDAVTRALHLFISDSIAYRKLSGNAVARATKEFDSIKQSNKLLSLYRSLQ